MGKFVKDHPSLLDVDFGQSGLKIKDLLLVNSNLLVIELLPAYLGGLAPLIKTYNPLLRPESKALKITRYVYTKFVCHLNDFLTIENFVELTADMDTFTTSVSCRSHCIERFNYYSNEVNALLNQQAQEGKT